MRILFIADTHGTLNVHRVESLITQYNPECIIGLGDIYPFDYINMCSSSLVQNIPVGGILGNHDSLDTFYCLRSRNVKIIDLHKRLFELEGISFIGMSGSLKYKESSAHALMTHQQSVDLLMNAPYADIILTHDGPYKKDEAPDLTGLDVDAHDGLLGITQYIRTNNPAFNIHGHLHENFVKDIYGTNTKELCIYEYQVLDICKLNNEIKIKRLDD